MEFNVKSGHPEKQRSACVVVGIYEPRNLSDAAKRIDKISKRHISSILRRGDLEGKIGQTLLLHNVPGTLADRILLVGCGRGRDLGDRQYHRIITQAVRTLHETGSMETVCYLTDLNVRGRGTAWRIRQAIETAHSTLYVFDQLKTQRESTRRPLRKIVYSVASRRELPIAEQASLEGQKIADSVKLAKDLCNLPGNYCTPSYLVNMAKNLCHLHENISCKILTKALLEEEGFHALLAVSKGSDQPPSLIILEYTNGQKDAAPIVLVGKGVTFHSGSLLNKSSEEDMDEMKFDMCGAAAVLGTISATAELQLPLNVVGIIPVVENLRGKATRSGDIITSLSGQTIEVINTDAESQLILSDALTYAERYNPENVIDIATSTGWWRVALGKHAHGLMTNYHPLATELLNAGKFSEDRAWELPLWEEYQEQLESHFADVANVDGFEADTITAACFLSRFTKNFRWAHLDVTGTAWLKNQKEKFATGRPVPLLTQYLINRSQEIAAEENKGTS